MIEIGDKPILWHIMKIYEAQGFNDFIICTGYKSYMIKEYFLNYYIFNSDITVNLRTNSFEVHRSNSENFRVMIIDTGLHTKTAGRLKRIRPYVGNEEFMLTYGDGVADINLHELLAFHRAHGRLATVTAVQPAGRFGLMTIEESGRVSGFKEKILGDGGWINGGFFILNPEVFGYLPEDADNYMWEEYPMEQLLSRDQLVAYKHYGFWHCMDALRDKIVLEELWNSGKAPWKIWE